jgi:hypothetical protein
MQRGIRRLTTGGFAALAFAVLVAAAPAAASAASVTTLPATQVGPNSARLNASINTSGQPATWQFQWGLTTKYNHGTPAAAIPAGATSPVPVSATISGLTPGTTYHFRIGALIGSGGPYSPVQQLFGADVTFRTQAIGSFGITSTRLTVKNNKVSVPFICASPLACNGNFSIVTHAKTQHGHTSTVVCTKSSQTFYRIPANTRKTVTAGITSACIGLMKHARGKSISAKLSSTPRTGQHGVIRNVTLVLK